MFSVVVFETGFGQNIKASISTGSMANRITIWLKPDVTQSPAIFSTLQFNVAIPVGIAPVPTMTVISSAFPGVTWIVDPGYIEGGFINYNIYTASSGYTVNLLTANTEFQAMELAFSGGIVSTYSNTAHLVCLANGGLTTGNALFYCTGSIFSNGQSLFYARDANVQFSNADSYLLSGTQVDPGTQTSFAKFATYFGFCPGNNVTYFSNISGATYRWQVDTGNGFINIPDGTVYSGTATNTLVLSAPPTSYNTYKYRCVVNGTGFSEVFTYKIGVTWLGTTSNVWNVAGNWSCGIIPDQYTDVQINPGALNNPFVISDVTIHSLTVNPNATVTVATGFNIILTGQ